MKKRVLIATGLLAILVICGGCNASKESSTDTSYGGEATGGAGWMPESSPESPENKSAGQMADGVRQNAKLILSANLQLQSQEFDKTQGIIEGLIREKGGYIENNETYGETGSRETTYTARVPQKEFESFLQQVGESCHVVRKSQSAQDVTEAYTDLEIHLATLKTKHSRLLKLLDGAEKMEDIIALENALGEAEYEIDRLSGEKRQYDSLVDFSTITIGLNETQILSKLSDGTSFAAKLRQAAGNGWSGFLSFLQGIALLIVSLWPILLLALVLGFVLLIIVRRRRRYHSDSPKPTSLPKEAPQSTPQEPTGENQDASNEDKKE